MSGWQKIIGYIIIAAVDGNLVDEGGNQEAFDKYERLGLLVHKRYPAHCTGKQELPFRHPPRVLPKAAVVFMETYLVCHICLTTVCT